MFVERYGQIGPDHERYLVAEVVAYERVVARGLAAVKIHRVRSPAQLADAVPVLLAVGLAWVLGLQAVEPAALICGVEHAAGNQCLDPGGKIVAGGDDAPGRRSTGMVQARVVVGQEGAGPGRGL